MGTKWKKYDKCPFCGSTSIASGYKHEWQCMVCGEVWDGARKEPKE